MLFLVLCLLLRLNLMCSFLLIIFYLVLHTLCQAFSLQVFYLNLRDEIEVNFSF